MEIAIVNFNLETVYHTKCRPDELPVTGPMSEDEFAAKYQIYGHGKQGVKNYPKFWLGTEITGVRPGDLDNKVL